MTIRIIKRTLSSLRNFCMSLGLVRAHHHQELSAEHWAIAALIIAIIHVELIRESKA